jgi:hypothetical protein
MLNKVKSRFSGKYVILLFLTLLIFTKTFTAEYSVPRTAYSVYAEDLDGDKDIVPATWYTPDSNKDISIYFNNGEINFDDVYVKVVEEAAFELFVADYAKGAKIGKLNLDHIYEYEKEVEKLGINKSKISPMVLPDYIPNAVNAKHLITKYQEL